jgi:hypothetical protein
MVLLHQKNVNIQDYYYYYYYYYTLPDRRIQLRGRKLYGVQQLLENIIVL